MRNSDMRAEIAFAFRKVPRLGRGWRYVPLSLLPEGTEVIFDCRDAKPDPEPADINGAPETHITPLAGGEYKLFISIWPTIIFDRYRESVLHIKPYSSLLAPSVPLQANFDRDSITYRLTTGRIRSILIPGTHFKLSDQDKDKVEEEPQRSRSSRGRRNSRGYQPLRSRWATRRS